MEHWWNDNDWVRPVYLQKQLSLSTTWALLVFNPGLRKWGDGDRLYRL